ncbi:MAG TPA: methionyl-tRNA formyltransferase [Fimbriimonadaceae bacterium]
MSIVYFGTGSFAVPPLEAIASRVSLVVTQPDRRSGRGMAEQSSQVKLKALELGLPVETPEKARDPSFVSLVASFAPSILVVASYGQILSTALLETAKNGGINLHGSILPKYRGAAPIQRAILNGETETGVTLMQMDRGMDTGDMIEIRRTPIGPDETYGELQDRLSAHAAEQIGDWVDHLVAGDYPRLPQDSELATIAPKITKEEAELHFDRDAAAEYNRFRAFTPAPGAFISTKFGKVRVSEARLTSPSAESDPGPTSLVGEGLVPQSKIEWGGRGFSPGTILGPNSVAFANGSLELLQVQPEGRKRMSGKDYFNGMRLKVGDSLRE